MVARVTAIGPADQPAAFAVRRSSPTLTSRSDELRAADIYGLPDAVYANPLRGHYDRSAIDPVLDAETGAGSSGAPEIGSCSARRDPEMPPGHIRRPAGCLGSCVWRLVPNGLGRLECHGGFDVSGTELTRPRLVSQPPRGRDLPRNPSGFAQPARPARAGGSGSRVHLGPVPVRRHRPSGLLGARVQTCGSGQAVAPRPRGSTR